MVTLIDVKINDGTIRTARSDHVQRPAHPARRSAAARPAPARFQEFVQARALRALHQQLSVVASARLGIAAGTGPNRRTPRGGRGASLRASVRKASALAAVVAESRTAARRLNGGQAACERSASAARAKPS